MRFDLLSTSYCVHFFAERSYHCIAVRLIRPEIQYTIFRIVRNRLTKTLPAGKTLHAMSTLSGILIIGLVIWFWLDSARAREIATGAREAACRHRDLQFLDQTVALRRIGLRWTRRGLRLRRLFRFDYSEQGVGRHTGHITLVGIDLEEFSLGLPGEPGEPPDRYIH